jgi:hypothetical protein
VPETIKPEDVRAKETKSGEAVSVKMAIDPDNIMCPGQDLRV